jgi:hypothetical protein
MRQRACRKSRLCGGARRRLAGVTSGRRSQPPKRPQVGATRSGATCARDRGVKGNARASTTAGSGRGRRGCSSEVARATVSTRRKRIGRGKMLTACKGVGRALMRRKRAGDEDRRRQRIGRRSGDPRTGSGKARGRQPAIGQAR